MTRRTAPTALAGLALAFLAWAGPSLAAPVDGMFLRVPNPIDDRAVQLIRRQFDDAVLNRKRPIKVVVFDFNPEDLPAATGEWNSANALAEFIRGLHQGRHKYPHRIQTVAYVQNEVTRHTVLPVVACEQVFFSSKLDAAKQYRARLGKASTEPALSDAMRKAYEDAPPNPALRDLVLRLLDRNLELHEVTYPKGGTHYFSPPTIKLLQEKGVDLTDNGVAVGLERGPHLLLDPELAQKFGLAQNVLPEDRAALAGVLKLTPRSLTEGPLLDREAKLALFTVRDKLYKGAVDDLKTQVKKAIKDGHNFLLFQLETGGGDTRGLGEFAVWLAELKVEGTDAPARTVAFVPPKTFLGAATFLALGCQEIILGPDAVLADFNYLGKEEALLKSVRDLLVPLAERRGLPPALFEAALTPGLALYHVKARKGSEERLLTADQFQADQKSATPQWQDLPARIEAKGGELLRIPADRAVQWGVALETPAPVNRLEEVYAYYGLDPTKVTVSKQGWLYQVAEFFRNPIVNFTLIMLGILGLILELKMPGTTVPGVIAAVCFVLFFWSYSFVGEFTMLASLLFVLGLILIVIEVFVLPGFGFPGIAGIFLIIFSLVLVTIANVPQTSQDWVEVGQRVTTLALGIGAAMIATFVLAYYLPSLPYASRLVLQPPDASEEGDEAPALPTYAHLLGAIGIAATTLRPSGKVQFGEEFHDVLAEGDYVQPGSRVQVIEVEGNRVVVKEI